MTVQSALSHRYLQMYAFQQNKRLIDDYMIRYVAENEMLEVSE